MKHKLFDWFLVLVVLVGGVLAWQTGRERGRLTVRHGRLALLTGDLPAVDATKVYLRAVDTGEPLHFAWRVYLPPSYSQQVSCASMAGILGSATASEFIARVRIRLDDQGIMEVYTHFGNFSSRSNLGSKVLAELLRGRWHKVTVEQLGAPELVALVPNQPAVLLRLALADDLMDEAKKTFSSNDQTQFVPILYELDLGPKPRIPMLPRFGEQVRDR
jgi:hypothetical protein